MLTSGSIFSEGDRSDTRPALHTESTFQFLDRCARPVCTDIRALIEEWFSAYPDSHGSRLKRRIQADDFYSAFFELFLHAYLRRAGYETEVEPSLSTGVRPDFSANGLSSRFILEATVVNDRSKEEEKRERQRSMIFDEINTVDSPNYFFDLVELTLKGADQPSASKIRRFLQRQIAASEYDELCRLAEQQVLPTWKYEDDRVRLLVQPIPKHDTKGDPSVRPLGIYPAKSRWGGTEIAIRTSLALKAKKFKGDVGPLVIALNVLSEWGFDWDDLVEAFFGTVQVVVDVQTRKSSSARAPDGIFRGPKGPRNTRISAVLATSILPWSVARSRLHLVHNPWAKHKLSPNVLPLDSISVIDGQLERKPGVPLYAVMGLSEDWARER